MPLTTDPQTTRLMDEFLIRGERMEDEQTECPYEAREVTTYARDLSDLAASAGPRAPRVVSGGRTSSLDEAEQAKLVQVVQLRRPTRSSPCGRRLRLALPAGTTAKLRDLTKKGACKARALRAVRRQAARSRSAAPAP